MLLMGVLNCLALGQFHLGKVRSLQIVKDIGEAYVFYELDNA
jgi:hypothetical protein